MADRSAPAPATNPLRRMLVINSVPRRWPFALRASICMVVPILAGWAAGDVPAGLVATIGGFTSLYGSGRPYLNRAMYLGAIAVSFAVVVALGDWAAATPWSAVLVVSVIAMAAVLICQALSVGPPGAYMPVLACAAAVGIAAEHLSPWRLGALVLAGGAFAWVVHMAGVLVRPRGPERAAVAGAAEAVATYIETSSPDARHRAAQLLHEAWITLVTFQPVHPKPDDTLYRLRMTNRRLHVLFAEAMAAADHGRPLSVDSAALARQLGTVPDDIGGSFAGLIPLGRPSVATLLRRAMTPGAPPLTAALRTAVAVAIAGTVTVGLNMDHAYWAMAAAVLMLHQGFDWRRTVQRGLERTLGTWLGLVLAGGILTAAPGGPWLALIVGTLQFVIEMFVVRNYTVAVIFITPAALTIASGGHHITDVPAMLLARGIDTVIGCAVALVVLWLTRRGHPAARPAESIAATLDAVAVVVGHLAAGAVTTDQARNDRRDLQVRAMAMLPVYDTAIGGSNRSRVAAERLWPIIVATEQLAYRTLATAWATEQSEAPFTPADAQRLTATLGDLADAVRTGRPAAEITEPPAFGANELHAIRASLA
ncbi:FUSC family protein [Mycobacterium sp. SMC-13]|uniref:FUSC family protein n=1 Tax=Mycobacterium sp. SMC-13 TaxID=3381626 RepID=UPI0038762453